MSNFSMGNVMLEHIRDANEIDTHSINLTMSNELDGYKAEIHDEALVNTNC